MSFRNPFFPATVTITPSGGTMPISSAAALPVKTNAGDSVTQTGAATTLNPPAGTPSAAARRVSSSSTATASRTNTGTTTLVAAPGVAAALELHQFQIPITFSGAANAKIQLQRSDTNAVIWDSGPATTASTVQWFSYDFEGATLPVNVGVNLVIVAGAATSSVTANLTYNVVS